MINMDEISYQWYLLDGVEGEVGSGLSGGVELYPQSHGELGGTSQVEGDDQGRRAGLGLVGEVEIIIYWIKGELYLDRPYFHLHSI